MQQRPYYVPLVVRENAKSKALLLVGQGYVQAHETLRCALCSSKYLFLCDPKDSGRGRVHSNRHGEALLYFADKINESHRFGHIEEIILLPYELHMVSSAHQEEDFSDAEDRKVG
ncbi:MAG TPA: hypothetical protein VFT65_12855 [Candidatus Angelobacter sp.]|nr:hypothetical protein [Candidatus Angelobacter sp.]